MYAWEIAHASIPLSLIAETEALDLEKHANCQTLMITIIAAKAQAATAAGQNSAQGMLMAIAIAHADAHTTHTTTSA
mgnify:CR=1 FL=1